MTPMNQGLRAVGTVELGGLKNPPSKRIDYIIKCARELLPNLGAMKMNGLVLGLRYQTFYLFLDPH